jgi:hypothetical protein
MQLYITVQPRFATPMIKHTYNLLSLFFTFKFSKSKVEES